MQQIRVVIAEHLSLVRKSISSHLAQDHTIKVVAKVNCEHELLRILDACLVDVLLLDISIPLLHGTLSFKAIKQLYPELRIIILSSFLTQSHIEYYLGNGASGCLDKASDANTLIGAIKAACTPPTYHHRAVRWFIKRTVS